MKPIKICFLSLSAYSLFNPKIPAAFGGAELQSYLLATELAKDPEFEISFIVGDYGQNAIEKYGAVNVYRLSFEKKKYSSFIRQVIFGVKLWGLLKTVSADIYQQRAAGASAGIIAYYCRRYGKKFVYMTASEAEIRGELRRRTMVENKLFYFGLKEADLILTQNVSHQTILKQKFHKASIIFKNVLSIPKQGAKEVRQIVLWVASSQPLKQPGIFLRLVRDFPAEKFVMIMPPHSHNQRLFNEIRIQARSLANLAFFEKVPFKKTTRFYNRAKALVNTSTFEGFPNTFVQAAASATPILSLNVNPDNFLDQEKCGLCANGNYKQLKSQLSKLLGNQSLWQEMSDNAYQYARKNHDVISNVAKYKALIAFIAKRGKIA